MKLPKIKTQALKRIVKRPTVKRRTLLIYLVLIISFSAALMIRSVPAKYGFYLNEFDPYYDYRITQFIVDSIDEKGFLGIFDYFSLRDNMAWYPEGRDVAPTSQGGLQFAGAILFVLFKSLFGVNISLYDFLVLFPVFFGALTIFAIFLLIRKIAGTGAGLLSSLILATSPTIISRGNLGWYKSEPLALFLAILSAYLFLSIFSLKVTKTGLTWRAILSGLLLGYANLSWGGSQYFFGVMGLLLLISPFLEVDLKRVIYGGSIFVSSSLITSAAFPRPGPDIIFGLQGMVLFAGLAFPVLAFYIKNITKPKNYRKVLITALIALSLFGLLVMSLGIVSGLSGRYLTAIFPFQKSGDALVESVAEHQTPTSATFFVSYWILIPLAAFGAFQMLRKRTMVSAYSLILGITAIYIASSFSRLMVYSSIAIAVLASIGFSELFLSLLKPKDQIGKKRRMIHGIGSEMKIVSAAGLIILLALSFSPWVNWGAQYDSPTSISISALQYNPGEPQTDWLEALTWIRENTPEDAIIISWWDYGYWITIMGNRTTLADNATINSTRIAQIGRLFLSNEVEAKEIIDQLRWDPNTEEYRPAYVTILFSATKSQDTCYIGGIPPFLLSLGGDEGKISWFASIPGLEVSKYLGIDGLPTEYFWNYTILGKMFPLDYDRELSESLSYEYNMPIQAGIHKIKYSQYSDDILRLAFASSFKGYAQVLVYEVVD
ncbi:MAG: hypothetical protein L6N96_04680 [Candidatus Methylarchaceae archaeon HK02M2]|nr:hypothetical protein [Candidatus Methylarchaceae archaeon HK02M2]